MSTVSHDIDNGRIIYRTILLSNYDKGNVKKNAVSPRKIAFTSYMNKAKQDGKNVNTNNNNSNNNNNDIVKHLPNSKTKRRKNNHKGQPLLRIFNNRNIKRKHNVSHSKTPILNKKKKLQTTEEGNTRI